ncbi:hypothetical protein CI109_101759 [Kwoniella shandongensis]|uniref:Uncharacterized protein n=1 Tax=Kwoniella shandongensis TaxID=1734106 RepID=A0A5M6C5B5_9TREE|nr:uncharacterized protein CI109_001119 [Kwoniella shandongensis]KAA5530318.1 hypothetical protein CI109_001119 [Kwoniella shandongensis]
MTTPPPTQPLSTGPRPPPRKGPNPLLLLGLMVVSSIAFLSITEKRQTAQARPTKREFDNPLLPSMKSEKVDIPKRRHVE